MTRVMIMSLAISLPLFGAADHKSDIAGAAAATNQTTNGAHPHSLAALSKIMDTSADMTPPTMVVQPAGKAFDKVANTLAATVMAAHELGNTVNRSAAEVALSVNRTVDGTATRLTGTLDTATAKLSQNITDMTATLNTIGTSGAKAAEAIALQASKTVDAVALQVSKTADTNIDRLTAAMANNTTTLVNSTAKIPEAFAASTAQLTASATHFANETAKIPTAVADSTTRLATALVAVQKSLENTVNGRSWAWNGSCFVLVAGGTYMCAHGNTDGAKAIGAGLLGIAGSNTVLNNCVIL